MWGLGLLQYIDMFVTIFHVLCNSKNVTKVLDIL